MTADQMPAELVAQPQRALEVDLGAALPASRRGDAQRLGGDVDRKEGTIALVPALHDRQARTGTGDRSADLDRVGIVATGNGQAAQAIGLLTNFKNLA